VVRHRDDDGAAGVDEADVRDDAVGEDVRRVVAGVALGVHADGGVRGGGGGHGATLRSFWLRQ
jgi:hypothetical protein